MIFLKTKKLFHFGFAVLFMLILFGTLLVLIKKPKASTSYYENRALAEKPAFSWSSLWDGSYFSDWETYLADHAVGRETLLHKHTDADLHLFNRPVVNEIVPSNGKLMAYYSDPPKTAEEIAAASAHLADQCADVNELVESYGGTFLCVAVPGQTTYYEDSYPWYLSEQSHQFEAHRDAVAADLAERNVPFLDIGTVYDALGHPDDFYSAGDHHYTFKGAFVTYQAILQQANTLSGLDFKIYQTDELNIRTLPNPYIGSRQRKLYSIINTNEHLVISSFKEPIAFRRYNNGSLGASTCYTLPDNDTEEVSYTAYMGGDYGETIIQTDRPTLPDLLICGDSFTNALETLLYASCDEMRSLDLRHYQEQTLYEYVSEHHPDVVIYLRDYGSLLSTEGNGTLE